MTTIDHDFTARTSFAVAVSRLGVDMPLEARRDEHDDDDATHYGYDITDMDAVVAMLVRENPASSAAILLQTMVNRSERRDGAVWFDTDRHALIAMLMNNIADSGRTGPVDYHPVAVKRQSWITRLLNQMPCRG